MTCRKTNLRYPLLHIINKKHHEFGSLQILEAVGVVGTSELKVPFGHTKPLPRNVSDLIYLFGTFFKTSLHPVQQIFLLHFHVLKLHQVLHVFIIDVRIWQFSKNMKLCFVELRVRDERISLLWRFDLRDRLVQEILALGFWLRVLECTLLGGIFLDVWRKLTWKRTLRMRLFFERFCRHFTCNWCIVFNGSEVRQVISLRFLFTLWCFFVRWSNTGFVWMFLYDS